MKQKLSLPASNHHQKQLVQPLNASSILGEHDANNKKETPNVAL